MPTYARKYQATSLVYHIYNRSNSRVPIFKQEQDFRYFIGLISGHSNEFKVYHWVIMSNHYHLAVEFAIPEMMSRIMSSIQRAYTHYHHVTYRKNGYLWQGRFKSQPIQKEIHLITCGRYIERNPVKAGIIVAADEYAYSSAACYCRGVIDAITQQDPYYIDFGLNDEQRRGKYREFLRSFREEEEASYDLMEHPQGNKEFTRCLRMLNGRLAPWRRGRRPIIVS